VVQIHPPQPTLTGSCIRSIEGVHSTSTTTSTNRAERVCGGLPEIAQPWHIQSRLAGPNPFYLVRSEGIQGQEIPVPGCRRTVMMKGSAEVLSPLFTERQASAYLSRSVRSLRRDRRNGRGPQFVRLGRSIRYLKFQLDAYISACGGGGRHGDPNA
jgi:hypothetical protein